MAVSQAMIAESVTVKCLKQLCEAVAQVADDIGGMISGVFGGSTPFGCPVDGMPTHGGDEQGIRKSLEVRNKRAPRPLI